MTHYTRNRAANTYPKEQTSLCQIRSNLMWDSDRSWMWSGASHWYVYGSTERAEGQQLNPFLGLL